MCLNLPIFLITLDSKYWWFPIYLLFLRGVVGGRLEKSSLEIHFFDLSYFAKWPTFNTHHYWYLCWLCTPWHTRFTPLTTIYTTDTFFEIFLKSELKSLFNNLLKTVVRVRPTFFLFFLVVYLVGVVKNIAFSSHWQSE